MDLSCKETIDFDRDQVEKEILEEERVKRYTAEVKIYFALKEFIGVLNQNAITPEYTLKVVASGYKQIKDDYQIIVYNADEWKRYFIDGLAKIIEEHWQAELNTQAECNFETVQVLKDRLYVTTYSIKSDHIAEGEFNFFIIIKFFMTSRNFFCRLIFFVG